MPELPEVETMRRGISLIEGQTLEDLYRYPCRKRPIQMRPQAKQLRRRLKGRQVQQVDRWGKRLILQFAGQLRLVYEPRMTGLVLLADPPTREHRRLKLQFSGGTDLLFWDRRGLGQLALLDERGFQKRFGGGQLGPDALTISLTDLCDALKHRRIPIKVGLLDQKAVAGIGNIYASEILFLAGVDPRTRCDRLTLNQWRRICNNISGVLKRAIQYEGSSLNDGTYRNALNLRGRYQNQHRVYGRADLLCHRCKSTRIIRIVQSQRATYFCRSCQRKRG